MEHGYLIHRNHSYIDRYMGKNGKWQYVYEKTSNAVKRNMPTVETGGFNDGPSKHQEWKSVETSNGTLLETVKGVNGDKKYSGFSIGKPKDDYEFKETTVNVGKNFMVEINNEYGMLNLTFYTNTKKSENGKNFIEKFLNKLGIRKREKMPESDYLLKKKKGLGSLEAYVVHNTDSKNDETYLIHTNHKYISKERVKGRWKYVYEGEAKPVSRRTNADGWKSGLGTGPVGNSNPQNNNPVFDENKKPSKKTYKFEMPDDHRIIETDDREKYERMVALDSVLEKNEAKYSEGDESQAYFKYTFRNGVEKLEEQIAAEKISKFGAGGMPTNVQNILVENADKKMDEIVKRMASNKRPNE